LAYKILKAGTGSAHPTDSDKVAVQYTGWQTDGTTFDSSFKRGRPATFRVNGVIAGWTEALQLMVEGEQIRVWIPEDLAYKGRKGRPSGMLVFDVELLEIK
jgi:peptidylprolyl isomerase